MGHAAWRIVFISTVPPVVETLAPLLRDLGHQPVAVISARRRHPIPNRPTISDGTVPGGLDLHVPAHRRLVEPLLRLHEPDLAICWGYPWRIPGEALGIARVGAINLHPGMLPRHRGPVPLSWALREGDEVFGVTWHRMDAAFDSGPILAQTSVPIDESEVSMSEVGPRIGAAAAALLPRVLERLAAGDPGDPQSEEGASYGGLFEDDYATVDWGRPARAIHRQVLAWRFAMGLGSSIGPIAELDDERVRLVLTSLTDPGNGSGRRVVCGDGEPLWVLETEPVP